MNALADISNALTLGAYSVRDILWLRILSVVSGIVIMPYYYYQPDTLWVSIFWGSAFVALNLVWIVILLMERRPVKLSDEEQHLYRLLFRTLTPREMVQLLKLATWQDKKIGDVLERQGEEQDTLDVIVSGRGRIVEEGKGDIGELREGEFIGKVSYLTGEKAPFSVVVEEPTRIVSWKREGLRKFLKGKTELAAAMQMTVGFDLVAALESARRASGLLRPVK